MWETGDDLCDCTFQRVGRWTNPYLAQTRHVRLCCIEAELEKQFPQFVQVFDAYQDPNTDELIDEPMMWNGEFDMPKDIWHRQLARIRGEDLELVREKFAGLEPPKGVPQPEVEQLVQQQQSPSTQLVKLSHYSGQVQTVGQ